MEGARYPLQILPEEMWIMIIMEAKDCEDVQSLMKASKQLKDISMKYRHFWLFENVLPFLIPTTKPRRYLEMEELKNLRLVDKRWNRAVATYLENQPYLRPYNKNDDKANSKAHIWSDIYPEHGMKISEGLGTVFIDDYDSMKQLAKNFKSPKDNPFLARSVIVCIPNYRRDQEGELQTFWDEVDKTVFKKFAQYISFLKLEWPLAHNGEWKPELMWKLIVKSLSSLPNLKGLHIGVQYQDRVAITLREMLDPDVKSFLQFHENQLPSMEFLESLKIFDFPNFPKLFAQQLMSKYCLQLRRFHIPVYSWDTRLKWTFPNLTELLLDSFNVKTKSIPVFKSLTAPQLAKLHLISGYSQSDSLALTEKGIFKLISFFPSLLYFEISNFFFKVESEKVQPPPNLKLKYLKINNMQKVNYDFLRYLPNLQRIQIGIYKDVSGLFRSTDPEVEPELKLDECALKVNPFNMWENCPKLKTVSVCHMDSTIAYPIYNYDKFDRVTYEKLENGDPKEHAKLRLKYLISLFPGLLQVAYDRYQNDQ